MQQWECIVCGWIYDEKVGDPDSGIAPGTKFEDIPDDWLCPECGVGKDDFELVEVANSSIGGVKPAGLAAAGSASAPIELTESDVADPIVILGSGLAGYGLLKELRKLDTSTPVIVITADDGRAYSKPALSTGYTKQTSADDLAQHDAGTMAKLYNASVWTNTHVTSVDPASHSIFLNGGTARVRYAKLVFATGANCIQAPLKGDALDRVYAVNDLLDLARLQHAMSSLDAKKVCIIGAGLIGCEFSNDLLNGGFQVEAVDPMQTCLTTLIPAEAGHAVQRALQDKGAKFHFGCFAEQVNHTANGVEVLLSDGSKINADIVLSAIGVRPNIEVAKAAGLATDRGIKVDRLLQSSAPNVYAVGDCAEVEQHVLVYIAPLLIGTRALAKTLSGQATVIEYPAMPVAIKTPACPVVVCPAPLRSEGTWLVTEQSENNIVAEFRNEQGQLIGFALTGSACAEKSRLQAQLPPLLS